MRDEGRVRTYIFALVVVGEEAGVVDRE